MEKILNYIESNKEAHLNELIEYLMIPSVSSESQHNEDTLRCAEWTRDAIKKAGIEKVDIYPTKGHPIVYGEWLEAGNAPTILIYGHYDVQPVDLSKNNWFSDPFDPIIKDNKIFGRGTADDKGQLYTHIKSIQAYMETNGKLPVNVKILIEGEEECGSNNLDIFIEEHKDMLACDTILISDTEWFADGLPSICYSLRGISYIEVTVTGHNRDLHSGTFGGAIDNPLNVLCSMVAKLKDEYGRIAIPGFYDDVLNLTEEERNNFKKLPFDETEYCKDLGISGTNGEFGYTTLERVWARPSLDLNGMFGGYTGEGAKTVIAPDATAKISMRLVPNQTADDITKKITDYLVKIAPPTVTVEVKPLHGGNPVLSPLDSKGIKAAVVAMEKAFGKQPVFMREGGSIPIVEVFQSVLGAPAVLLGLGLPGDNIHSHNENFDLDNFFGGIKASAIFFDEITRV
jgi:acetylornithine deacetylase/succinyl-diaminopimelate desuccinylase-like protein